MTTALAYPLGSFLPHFASTETGERWLAELSVDFSNSAAVDVAASLAGVFRGAAVAYRIRIGGTSGTVDGFEVLNLELPDLADWTEGIVRMPKLVARGVALFKLTVQVADAETLAEVNAATLTLWVSPRVPPIVRPLMSDLGIDIWMGDNDGSGAPDTNVTPAGDWKLVSGREAIRQSLQRRFETTPGEYATKPDYGAGLLAAVKSRGRRSDLDAIKNRLQAQALKDERVTGVLSVKVDPLGSYGLRYSVVVKVKGDGDEPLEIFDNLQEDEV